MHFHWQNLNEDREGRVKGWPFHGRAWLTLSKLSINWEWNFWSHFCAVALRTGQQESGTGFWIAFPPISFHLHFAYSPWLNKREREISIQFFSGSVWWKIFTDPMSLSSSMPKWREGNLNFVNLFLGRFKYSERARSTHEVVVPMPEGAYKATVKLQEHTWKRPRWFARRKNLANVEIPEGIPHQGKGENSWDCGEDRLYGLSTFAETVEQAISRTTEAALQSRRKYDGNVMANYPAPKGVTAIGVA